MSQKSSRRARRQTNDEDTPPFKAPTPKPNGTDEAPSIPEEKEPKEPTPPPEESPEQEAPKEEIVPEKDVEKMVTRSRSTTPQVKKIANGHEEEIDNTSAKEEMEPLIVSDEPDPELDFEESSDLESGRDSPVLSRCRTRRSHTRNIPTPKTPKLDDSVKEVEEETAKEEEEEEAAAKQEEEEETAKEDEEEETEVDVLHEVESQEEEEVYASSESCSDISTKVHVGGDSTRLNYTESNIETNSFLQEAKNKSFGEALRRLSTRRTIRPISDDYRRRLLQTNLVKNDSYPTRNSIERIAAVGLKRKNDDGEEQYTKRFKPESPGFFARFTSPLASIRSKFGGDNIASSTPKLTGYKDDRFLLEQDGVTKMCELKDGERRWCSIM